MCLFLLLLFFLLLWREWSFQTNSHEYIKNKYIVIQLLTKKISKSFLYPHYFLCSLRSFVIFVRNASYFCCSKVIDSTYHFRDLNGIIIHLWSWTSKYLKSFIFIKPFKVVWTWNVWSKCRMYASISKLIQPYQLRNSTLICCISSRSVQLNKFINI